MIPRLAPPLLVVLLVCTVQEVHSGVRNKTAASTSTSTTATQSSRHHDDMESFLHGMDSKQTVSVVAPEASIRQDRTIQLNEESVDLKVTTESYQTHIPFGTRLRPLSSPKPYTPRYGTEAPSSHPLKRPLHHSERPAALPPTQSPIRFVAPPPPSPFEPRAHQRGHHPQTHDIDRPIILTDSPKRSKRRRLKQSHPLSTKPHKEHRNPKTKSSDFSDFGVASPITDSPVSAWLPPATQAPFKDVPYEPLPPPPPPTFPRQRKTDFGEAINKGALEVAIAPRQPHLPNQPNRFEPVPAARLSVPPPPFTSLKQGPNDDQSRKPRKKDINFDSILDFIDRNDKVNSPKTSGRKRGSSSSGKFFSPKEDSATAFKPNNHASISNLKNSHRHEVNTNNNHHHHNNGNNAQKDQPSSNNIDNGANKENNKTAPNFNKRIAFLQDNPFQGSPQAFFFFTNVGPNHIEYRGVFNPSAVPLNFKDSPDALFQLIPQLPKLFNFDNRGIPPPQEPPKPRQPLPPRLPLPPAPPVIEDPVPLAPIALPPAAPLSHTSPRIPLNPPPPPPPPPAPVDVPLSRVPERPTLIQPEPPRPVYPLALPPPPNLQLADRPINQPFPKYDFVRGSFDGYPKIFRFNDERISILDFDKQKKAGQVIRRKGDDLDPERVPRNSFLIFHGGQFPSKEDSLSRNRLDNGVKNNRFRNFVDFGNFLE